MEEVVRKKEIVDLAPGLRRMLESAGLFLLKERLPPKIWGMFLMLCILPAVLMPALSLILPAEYVSPTRFLGLPLLTWGETAVGWIALGGTSVGLVSVGGLAVGGVAFGGVSVGVISLGGMAFGFLMAVAGLAVGYYSFGGMSIGAFAYSGKKKAKGYYVAQGGHSETLWGPGEAQDHL